jgi:hypothetical protein
MHMTPKLILPLAFCALIAACAAPVAPSGANASTPGWTGSTIVLGNNSTIEGDAQATYLQQKWGSPVRR